MPICESDCTSCFPGNSAERAELAAGDLRSAAELVLYKRVAKPKKAAAAAPAKQTKKAAAPALEELRFKLEGDVMTTPTGHKLAIDRLGDEACQALTREFDGHHVLLVDGQILAEDDCGYGSHGFAALLAVYKAIMM